VRRTRGVSMYPRRVRVYTKPCNLANNLEPGGRFGGERALRPTMGAAQSVPAPGAKSDAAVFWHCTEHGDEVAVARVGLYAPEWGGRHEPFDSSAIGLGSTAGLAM